MLDLLFPIPVCKYFLGKKKARCYKVLMGSGTEVSATTWSVARFQICIPFFYEVKMTMEPMCARSVVLSLLFALHTDSAGWETHLPPASAVAAEEAVPRCSSPGWLMLLSGSSHMEICQLIQGLVTPTMWVLMSSCRRTGARKPLLKAGKVIYSQPVVCCMITRGWVSVLVKTSW